MAEKDYAKKPALGMTNASMLVNMLAVLLCSVRCRYLRLSSSIG